MPMIDCHPQSFSRGQTRNKAMQYLLAFAVVIVMGAVFGVEEAAEEDGSSTTTDDEVVVTLSVKGANEVSADFTKAVGDLADVLKDIQTSGVNLPQEDMDSLKALLESANVLIDSLGKNADQISVAINNAKTPAVDLTNAMMTAANEKAIDPAIEKLNKSIKRAFWSTIFIVVLIASVIAFFVWQATRKLTPVFASLQKIADGHVIVPREGWTAGAAMVLDTEPDKTESSDEVRREPSNHEDAPTKANVDVASDENDGSQSG